MAPQVARLCSVWRGDGYDYYQTGGAPRASRIIAAKIGVPIGTAVPRLPLLARKVGKGEAALGCICRSGVPSVPFEWIAIGALAALLLLKR